MALILKTLKAVALGSDTIVYPTGTFPIKKNALLRNIILTNKTTNPATVSIQLGKSTGTYFYISQEGVILGGSGDQLVVENEVTLNLNEGTPYQIKVLVSGTTPSVDCVINGFERDVE